MKQREQVQETKEGRNGCASKEERKREREGAHLSFCKEEGRPWSCGGICVVGNDGSGETMMVVVVGDSGKVPAAKGRC